MTSVRDGAFYGWPYSYYGQHDSWNRRPHSGYKVIFAPFEGGQAFRRARRCADGFPQRGRQCLRPTGRGCARPAAYDDGHTHMLLFADTLTDGIAKQFPGKFKKWAGLPNRVLEEQAAAVVW